MWQWIRRIGNIGTYAAAWLGFLVALTSPAIHQFFYPFDPKASIARPILYATDHKGRKLLTIALAVSFANRGSAAGCIVDIALKLRDKATGTEWAFFPAKYLEPGMYDYRDVAGGGPRISGPPTIIKMEGGGAVTKAIWFFPRPPQGREPMGINELRAGEKYDLSVYTLSGDQACLFSGAKYHLVARDVLEAEPELVKGLQGGKPVDAIVKTLDTSRDTFVLEK